MLVAVKKTGDELSHNTHSSDSGFLSSLSVWISQINKGYLPPVSSPNSDTVEVNLFHYELGVGTVEEMPEHHFLY